jgi:hypothetical protein
MPILVTKHMLYLTYRPWRRKVEQNRDQLTPFSAPSGPARSSETYSSTTKKFSALTLDVSLPFIERSLTQAIMAEERPASQSPLPVANQKETNNYEDQYPTTARSCNRQTN